MYVLPQLPPALEINPQRQAIERFKRALFAQQGGSINLKTELGKVIAIVNAIV